MCTVCTRYCLCDTPLLTCVSLVVFQHVDLLGELAVALLTLVLFDAFVQLHVVPQSVFGLHACTRKTSTQCSMLKHYSVTIYSLRNEVTRSRTFATLCTQEVPDVVVDPEVLLQHVLPGE